MRSHDMAFYKFKLAAIYWYFLTFIQIFSILSIQFNYFLMTKIIWVALNLYNTVSCLFLEKIFSILSI